MFIQTIAYIRLIKISIKQWATHMYVWTYIIRNYIFPEYPKSRHSPIITTEKSLVHK